MNPNNKTPPLRILQWNARSVKPKTGDLINIANSYDIILLSETWLKPTQPNFNLTGFILLRKDSIDQQGGGIAIATRDNIPCSRINGLDNISVNLQLLGVLIRTQKGEISIISLYKKPQVLVSCNEWSKLLNYSPNAYASVVGGGRL